jgi:glycosyltransferase involved in cell wall biosynthesis
MQDEPEQSNVRSAGLMPVAQVSSPAPLAGHRIAVVIPCYRVAAKIMDVIDRIGPECWRIYVVDDACPQHSGDVVEASTNDARVRVIRHRENQGVGGAVMAGYRAAIADGATIMVKIDGDGQMQPELLPSFVLPIVGGYADYTKGNRFYDLQDVGEMPRLRLVGNAVVSFLAKLSSGYWDLFDPANGYTAIHAAVAQRLPFDRISRRYFFETDMLFRLNTLRAVIVDVPMKARYGDEVSNLRISRIFGEFLYKHARNALKRIFYNYYLRDFTVASLELLVGFGLLLFGALVGITSWAESAAAGIPASAGTVMLAGLPTLAGLQLLLAFISHDVATVPRHPVHPLLALTTAADRSRYGPAVPSTAPSPHETHDDSQSPTTTGHDRSRE